MIYPILESVISSAEQIKPHSVKIVLNKLENPFLVSSVSSTELRRALLNLVTNAIQSIKHNNGKVTISLKEKANNVIIQITDDGTGIDQETLDKLNKGEKIQAKNGRGLGFNYAKNIIEHFGGKIELSSRVNKGVTQIIILPIAAQNPVWFINEVHTSHYNQIVILDDDKNVSEIYKNLFKNKRIQYFHQIAPFEKYITANKKNNLFIIDYSLGRLGQNGIEIIKKHNLQQDSILITNMYLEQKIKDQCTKNNIKMLPKAMISLVKLA